MGGVGEREDGGAGGKVMLAFWAYWDGIWLLLRGGSGSAEGSDPA